MTLQSRVPVYSILSIGISYPINKAILWLLLYLRRPHNSLKIYFSKQTGSRSIQCPAVTKIDCCRLIQNRNDPSIPISRLHYRANMVNNVFSIIKRHNLKNNRRFTTSIILLYHLCDCDDSKTSTLICFHL